MRPVLALLRSSSKRPEQALHPVEELLEARLKHLEE